MEPPEPPEPPELPEKEEAEAPEPLPALSSAERHGQVLLVSEGWEPEGCCQELGGCCQEPGDRCQEPGGCCQEPGGCCQEPQDLPEPPAASASRRRSSGPASCTHSACSGGSKRRAEPCARPDGEEAEEEGADGPGRSKRARAPTPPAGSEEHAGDAGPAARRLLLVLCRASVLRSQLPQLQLRLQQVRARERQTPVALLGILVQPPRGEEAEARRRLESLLRSAFAPHGPAVEVHTGVFCPSRPDGALDVQCAPAAAHPTADGQSQTDGEAPRSAGPSPRERAVSPLPEGQSSAPPGVLSDASLSSEPS